MAVNELSWRKFPRDTMRNEELDYVAYLLGPQLAAAPFLFFTTAYCKADDDGVFDIEDGVIFARLMRLGTPQDVVRIASLLEERKIITRVLPDTNIFMLTEWDPPVRPGSYSQKSRTAEERRRAVAAKIEAEKKAKPAPHSYSVNFSAVPQPPADFFCPDGDKIQKNVVIQREREERETQTEPREEIRDRVETHTLETRENERLRESEGLRANINALQPYAAEKAESLEKQEEKENLAAMALSGTTVSVSESEKSNKESQESASLYSDMAKVCEVFSAFFAKNCLGFDAEAQKKNLETLACRIVKLKDDKNPAGIIASVFCSQFAQLSNSPGHYQNVPLTIEKLLNPEIYMQVCSRASKILLNNGKSVAWEEQMQKDRLEADADREEVYNQIQADCIKYGVDPNSKNVMLDIILAKKRLKSERRNE